MSQAVIDTSKSPFVKLRPVPVSAVRLEDAFWEPRIRRNREITIPTQLQHCEVTGRIDNFRRASGKKKGLDFQGIYFNDSDVYKWAEAASWSLATHPDPQLDSDLDGVIAEIAAAQDANGYLNTYFMFEKEKDRFTNLKDLHEIYCAGHLFQAAVAHHRATGKRTFLDVACKLADHLDSVFGEGRRIGACGHEEAEMGLVELYRTTGETRYLTLAKRMVEARGQKPPVLGGSPYHQDHLPFTEQTDFVGHAVRHLYLACGATDIAAETEAPAYRSALDALWKSLTERRMYVTGGAGSRWEGEAFGEDYELPNDRAYTETCAAIGSVMWNWRMLNDTGDTKYADLLETTLYNAVLPGLSLDGTHYFYQNPLADRGNHRRQEWFGCACCPPNVARLLASLPGYFYSVDDTGNVWAHLYATGTATLTLPNGGTITLKQEADYPWSEEITFTIVESSDDAEFLYLRIPAWAEGAEITMDDEMLEMEGESGTYAAVSLARGAGTVICLTLPMPIERIESHPHVLGNRGRIALKRGPLVYCIEQADFPDTDVWDVQLPDSAELTEAWEPDLLDGVIVLRGQAVALDPTEWEETLYALYQPVSASETIPVAFTAIPYHVWANREAGPMQVWIPTRPA